MAVQPGFAAAWVAQPRATPTPTERGFFLADTFLDDAKRLLNYGRMVSATLLLAALLAWGTASSQASAGVSLPGDCPAPRSADTPDLRWLAASLELSLNTRAAANERTAYVAYRALAERILGRDVAHTEATLGALLARQLPREAGESAGFFPWTFAEREVSDRNSIEFVSLPLALLLGKYGSCFTPEFRERLRATLALAAGGLAKDAGRVTVGYTNIWIMNSLALALIGEALGHAQWASQGYEQLSSLADLIRRSGITEYDSATYYGVDIIALHAARGLLVRKEGREVVGTLLDHFWTDIAANFFAARATLSGPHSRTYDFLRGRGLLNDVPFILAGLRPVPSTPAKIDLINAMLWLGLVEAPYQLPAEAKQALAMPSRVVTQHWHRPGHSTPGEERYNFVTPEFALGSTSAGYGPQDRPISLELAGASELPSLVIVPRAVDPGRGLLDDAYGLTQQTDASGHEKATHLFIRPAVAQDRGVLLALVYSDPPTRGADRLVTNLVLPIPDDAGEFTVGSERIAVDTAKVAAGQAVERPVTVGERVAFRQRHTGVALRLFAASGCDGQGPNLMLQFAKDGADKRAGRLVVRHVTRSPRPARGADCDMRIGFLLAVDRVETDADWHGLLSSVDTAEVREQIGPKAARRPSVTVWSASVRFSDGPFRGRALRVERMDELMNDGRRVTRAIAREVNGRPMRFEVLGVSAADPHRP